MSIPNSVEMHTIASKTSKDRLIAQCSQAINDAALKGEFWASVELLPQLTNRSVYSLVIKDLKEKGYSISICGDSNGVQSICIGWSNVSIVSKV
ncbi:hypothetical protein Acj133p185 [Acinetobacter phage 133]|uniref:Uncharacterized protein n=1 Tax=Acinetobacter phage 133 TaxID=2919552 RepID=D9I6B9_9CAUD|nr:hypothetical protein Acj133p185 [Acinetobacter phage 133]ADJ19500.1 hypothetical protein Acj133p185 [Acinetobacter phage 133]